VKPFLTLAETATPDGARLTLHARDGEHFLYVDGMQLMSSRAAGSEQRLAELALEPPGLAAGRILIGGLGLGFTLRRVLELAAPTAKVQVAELVPEIVRWNRELLPAEHRAALEDPRVELLRKDVVEMLGSAREGSLAAVMLDVDNGPAALVARRNRRLYGIRGLEQLRRRLAPGGRAVFWSASRDDEFLARLRRAGFEAQAQGAKAYPAAKRNTHTLFVADRGAVEPEQRPPPVRRR
jgi:spermidine synthase